MSKKNKQLKLKNFHYLKAVVIVHGKSELQMCKFIKNNLRIKIEFISKDSGKSSIQITSLKDILNGKDIKDFNSFCK
ncbi:hypothetical protein [Brachyspira catarrhinii]|uniref:Uncharacterized protein n=1 Tax=Brachyspira catarrhinii TaxID=2528966 RepID=A0ABY2TTD1_9SPIR|nr:hypothetical protein [Brachyspira catarrhinii]TKZ36141.1 hypothetical protein EZH24_01550 [Brachyspira catarrhinii]